MENGTDTEKMTWRRGQERETERVAGPKSVSAFWWLLVSACVLALFFRET